MKRVSISEIWDEFAPLAAKALKGDDSTPQDIWDECNESRAWAFASDDCFVIVQTPAIPFRKGFQLAVWVVVARKGARNVISKHMAWLTELALQLGACRIIMSTRRRGFERALPAPWKLDRMVYECEVSHG